MKIKKIYLFFGCIFSLWLHAEPTTIIGQITDEQTGEGLENVNIVFQGTHIGTTSDKDGMYFLQVDLHKKMPLVFTTIGYKKHKVEIEPAQSVAVDVQMQEKSSELREVFISPGKNPAVPIIEQVKKHKLQNDKPVDQVQINEEISASNLHKRHLSRLLTQNAINQADTNIILPLYASQGTFRLQKNRYILDHYDYQNHLLLTASQYDILLERMQSQINFYDNHIHLLQHTFLSPLATNSHAFYRYFLMDSIVSEQGKEYWIRFKPKNPYNATFSGDMYIDSSTYAISKIQAHIPNESNINYLTNGTIEQTYQNGCLQTQQFRILLDFLVQKDSTHFLPTVLVTSNLQTLSAVNDFTPIAQPETTMMDSLEQTPLFKVAHFMAYTMQTGYMPWVKYAEIGKTYRLLQLNKFEGVSIGLPVRTTEAFSKSWCLNAYVRYGFGDDAWKGGGLVQYKLPLQRRHVLNVQYTDDYTMSDVSDFDEYRNENAINKKQKSSSYVRQYVTYSDSALHSVNARRSEVRFFAENDWTDNVQTKIIVRHGKQGYGPPTTNYFSQPTFTYTSLQTFVRWGYKERKIDRHFQRYYLYNDHYPTCYFGAEYGTFSWEDHAVSYPFAKFNFMVKQRVSLGIMGRLHYLLQGTICAGKKAPDALRAMVMSNGSWTYSYDRFSLIHSVDFVEDRLLQLHLHWNGQGVLFNTIPGIRYLRLRELASCKVAYGNGELKTPYIEMSAGIGNIFRVFELQYFWRLTHRELPNTRNIGLRFTIRVEH